MGLSRRHPTGAAHGGPHRPHSSLPARCPARLFGTMQPSFQTPASASLGHPLSEFRMRVLSQWGPRPAPSVTSLVLDEEIPFPVTQATSRGGRPTLTQEHVGKTLPVPGLQVCVCSRPSWPPRGPLEALESGSCPVRKEGLGMESLAGVSFSTSGNGST